MLARYLAGVSALFLLSAVAGAEPPAPDDLRRAEHNDALIRRVGRLESVEALEGQAPASASAASRAD